MLWIILAVLAAAVLDAAIAVFEAEPCEEVAMLLDGCHEGNHTTDGGKMPRLRRAGGGLRENGWNA